MLFKRKKSIIALTISALVIGAIMSFVLAKPGNGADNSIPDYNMSILISPINLNTPGENTSTVMLQKALSITAGGNETNFVILGDIIEKVKLPSYSAFELTNLMKSDEFLGGSAGGAVDGRSLKAERDVGNLEIVLDAKAIQNNAESNQVNQLVFPVNIKIKNATPARIKSTKDTLTAGFQNYVGIKIKSDIDKTLENLKTESIAEKDKISELQKKASQSALKAGEMEQLNIDYGIAVQTLANYQMMTKNLTNIRSMDTNILINTQITTEDNLAAKSTSKGLSKSMIIVISAMLGLMLGIFLALFLEYWEKGGKEEWKKVMSAGKE